MSQGTIYYKANLFDQAGMASLLPPAPPPEIPRQDRRSLPPNIRQEIVDLHAQYPAFRPHEIATICFVKFNRKPAPATIKLVLASGPKPSTTERRHPRYAEIEDGKERRRVVIRLHVDGWNAKSIAGYLDVSRKTVHGILRRFAQEQFAGLEDKSHARTGLRKVDMQTIVVCWWCSHHCRTPSLDHERDPGSAIPLARFKRESNSPIVTLPRKHWRI